MKKPYVIIHTHTSIDGKINFIDSPKFDAASRQYQEVSLYPDKRVYDIQGYLNGRISTDDNITNYEKPDIDKTAQEVPEGDFVANAQAPMYYVSIDPSGKLGWKQNFVDYGNVKSHVIEVLTERASNGYKDFLRRMDISYIIAGKDQLDNALVLDKLATLFNFKKLMIGGGGTINWAFLQGGLVDEVSLMVGPFANGNADMKSLFAAKEPLSKIEPITFTLIEAKAMEDSVVWLRYRVDKND